MTDTPATDAPASATTTDADEPTTAGQLDLGKVERYVELRAAQKASEAESDALKAEADALERDLVELFAEAGMQSVNAFGRTVYLHRATYAQRNEGVTADDVKAALRAAGADDLISETVNAQTLSAYVRELVDADDAPGLPEPLAEVLSLGERYSVRLRAGGKTSRRKA